MKREGWRRCLKPLVSVYAGLLDVKEHMLAHQWLKQRRLGHPVISVGSLSAGGAGKTPVVMMLAELLSERGFEVRILTRGYGRSRSTVERVAIEGDAKRFGDEPLMMARQLAALKADAAIWVGADRYRAGSISEKKELATRPVVYLLDDGFQHRKLIRDIDVVLLTREDLTDTLLPAGNLREPLKAMLRADIIVLREDEGFAGGMSGKAATWFIRRGLRLPEGTPVPKKAIAFCGVARPEGFFAMLKGAGVEVTAASVFRDHHVYSASDVEELLELALLHEADGFVTTEKDAVKLSAAMRMRLLSAGPLVIPKLTVALRDEAQALGALIRLVEAKLAATGS